MMNEQKPLVVNKFGGGIMKDAEAIRHLPEVLKQDAGKRSINVFSAFGKTTDKLEQAVKSYENREQAQTERLLDELSSFHRGIVSDLFPPDHEVFKVVDSIFNEIKRKLSVRLGAEDMKFVYDQIVPYGEILASIIVSHYLAHVEIPNILATDILKTDSSFKEANVDKEATAQNLNRLLRKVVLELHDVIITQGFIGSSEEGMTTLGREGSDYTAGILGNLAGAVKVVLYKAVPGVMDKNPHKPGNEDARKKDTMTYEEAEESLKTTAEGLVHRKTLNELKPKNIPLQVRPYWELESEGTIIGHAR